MKIVETKHKKEKVPPREEKQERSRHASPKAVVIKPAKGSSFADILMDLKKRINPEKMGALVHGNRTTRSKDLLVELRCASEVRRRLSSAFRHIDGSRYVRYLVLKTEVEISDINITTEVENGGEALRTFFENNMALELKVSLKKRPYRSPSGCWSCGKEGYTAAVFSCRSRCFLGVAKQEKTQINHLLRIMRFAAFRKATPKRKL